MAVSSVHLGRVSQNMQMNLLRQGMQDNLVRLLREQERLSTGQDINRPSDDPLGAVAVLRMEEALETQKQYLANIDHASKVMNLADGTIGSIRDLIVQAHTLAISDESTDTEEHRNSAATLIDSIIGQIVTLGNTEYLGSYIFAGQENTNAPFSMFGNQVKFNGNEDNISVQVSQYITEKLSLVAKDIFGTGLGKVAGYSDLAPAANDTTRLSDIGGTLDRGIRLGIFTVTGSVSGQFDIDLTGCENLGEVVKKVNDALPATLNLAIEPDGRRLSLTSTNPGETLTITESGLGTVAHDLGLYTPVAAVGSITGEDFGAKLTLQTEVSKLNGNAGLDLTSGIVITNGDNSVTIDFASAKTVQDILNTINTSGVGVKARINDEGTGIDVINQLAGARLTIGENGGSTAEDLGIRTLRKVTKLADLNEGLGVNTMNGADFRVTTSDGSTVDVDISGAETLEDVVDRINTQAVADGVALTAGIAADGNGIVLTDNTGGAGHFLVTRQNLSNAAEDLGILQEVPAGSQIVGEDVNPTKEESIFTYLLDLRNGLRENDTQAIEQAAQSIETFLNRINEYHGKLSFMAKGLGTRKTQTEDAVLSTKALVSNIKDLDYIEAITQFQTLQSTLQANLQSGSQILKTSLLDYLG